MSPSADTRYLLQKIDWSQGIFGKPMVTAATRSKENVHGAVRVEHWSADPGSWMIRVANWGWWVKEHFRLTVLCVPQVLLLFLQLDCSHSTKSSAEIFYRILWYPADWILSSNASQKHQLWHASCAPKVCGYIIKKKSVIKWLLLNKSMIHQNSSNICVKIVANKFCIFHQKFYCLARYLSSDCS